MSSELTHNPGQFDEVIHIIDNARSRAMKAVNAELIQMYWSVGAYLSELCSASSFGDKIIDEVASYIAQENPNIKGFNRRGLYRMKQFYETYKDDEFVTPLVTQISWTNHLLIMSGSKTADERHFYMALCAKDHYSKRELECQIGTSYYERSVISAKKRCLNPFRMMCVKASSIPMCLSFWTCRSNFLKRISVKQSSKI